jgi:hypothetical protein
MRVLLIGPGGREWHLDLPGNSPQDAQLLGDWLRRIFSDPHGNGQMRLEYRLVIN